MEKPSVFISYNHESSSVVESIVNKLDDEAYVFWDKRLGYWKSFKEFMNTIGKQDYVVIVISDAYLKSPNCQYEVLQLMTNKDWDKKTMFVVENTKIYDIKQRAKYIDFWAKQERKYKRELTKHDPAALPELVEEIKKCGDIRLHIGDFLKVAADANNPNIDAAIDGIVNRVKISSKRSSAIEIEEEIVRLIRRGINTIEGIAIATNRAERTIRSHIAILISDGRILTVGERRNRKFIVAAPAM